MNAVVPLPAETKTVLIAEDDSWLRKILAELFLDEGYQVFQAADGAAALRVAERQSPDVVVLDLKLPALSGLAVLQRLRAQAETASLPVIVVSAAVDLDVRAALGRRSQRADSILEKPLDVGRLFHEVEQAAWSTPRPAGVG
jgi:two-component system response regulator (stage 0 sporulation protein F)